ncbi:hypothetical protein BDZ94DRAFT_683530 [Collybia nuda]|uniref:Ubiquitin-like protease family profile domain-containing protein n=1 Tax=Collybia nuda TaxID=64659 RepID=A0A9P6CJL7_9AGAR|nr:hypothetical protein BDZ94DRAFT_683530 [Collybia nuda]
MDRIDRDKIAFLHGQSKPMLNMRDASNQISTAKIWNKPPTPISTPTFPRRNQTGNQAMHPHSLTRRVGSPYDNMGSSRNRIPTGKSNAYGNKTATMVLCPSGRTAGLSNFIQGSSNTSRRSVKSADIIEIVDNDEDVGVPVQSDPMNMVDDPPYIPPSKKPKLAVERAVAHPPGNLYRDEPYLSAEKCLPMDGADTIALERQINNQDSDVIEEFSDDSSYVKVGVQRGNVHEKVARFEGVSPPHLDLRVITQKQHNIKGKMKSKSGKRAAVTNSIPKPSTSRIRIKEFFLGTEHKNSEFGYYLSWDSKTNKNTMTIKEDKPGSNANGFQFIFDISKEIRGIKSTQFPIGPDLTVLEFTTSSAYTTGLNRESVNFKMGDSQAIGKITLKFDTDYADWSDANYAALLKWIRQRVHQNETIIGLPAARSMWETVTRSAEIQQAGLLGKRKSAFEESSQDQRPTKRSAPNSVETTAMNESSPPPPDNLSRSSSKPPEPIPMPSRMTVIPQPQRTRDSPPEAAGVLRRSSRKAAPTIERPPSVDLDEVILCYPQGVPGAVNITNADFKRLQPGEFLNDTLIEFGLKLWLRNLESINPELAKQIHVFSSFFYKKLNTKNIEDGYNSVRKWTSKFDLFSKNLHWYLAIIYHPAHILNPPLVVETQSPTTRRRAQTSSVNEIPPTKSVSPRVSPTSATPPAPEIENKDGTVNDSVVEKSLLNFDASCSISVMTDCFRNATEPPDTLEVVPPFPPSEMDIDSGKLQEGKLYDISPTLSDYNSGGVPSPDFDIHDADSSSTGAAEVEQLFANDMDIELASRLSVVKSSNFYGASSEKVQGKQRQSAEVISRAASQEDEGEPSLSSNPVPTTYIFTLDSLNSRHPQAIRQLARYLKLEAKDKRNISETSDPCGKMAAVPVQPNFCDCGLYLVHFAQKFVTDPDRYCHIINTRTKNPPLTTRREDWEESKIADMRENMANDIRRLSVEWKKAKEEARRKEANANTVEVIESTDDEVDIVETISAPGKEKGKGKRSGAPKRGPARRLR